MRNELRKLICNAISAQIEELWEKIDWDLHENEDSPKDRKEWDDAETLTNDIESAFAAILVQKEEKE